MTRPVLLLEIGDIPLPAVTPAVAPAGNWSQAVYTPPAVVPPIPEVTPTPVADGILLEWEPVRVGYVQYIIERSRAATGPWAEIARTSATRYLYTGPRDGLWYFRVTASVNGRPGLGGIANGQSKDVPGMQEIVDHIKQSEIGQQLVTAIDGIDVNSETIIKQALEQYELANGSRQNRAYIARVEETSVTVDQARAMVQQTVAAETGPIRSAVQATTKAVADLNGKSEASHSIRTQLNINGKHYMAGIVVGVYSDGDLVQREVLALADTFGVLSTASDGTVYSPFIINNGKVYINQAFIGDGWINNAMIGNTIQSDNFLWDDAAGIYRGWQILKNGQARFAGDVLVRGTVIAEAISGRFQRTQVFTWSGVLSADFTGFTSEFVLDAPIRYGDSHQPVLMIELSMENDGDHSRDGVITIQYLINGNWVDLRTKTFTLAASTQPTNVMIVPDSYVSTARRYRIRVSRGTNSWGSWRLTGVTAQITGMR
ncbi:DUF1983 domain-containing protein [Stenotrophomonas maltophilia]